MGKFKDMVIEAQDAVITDYETMYEIMPQREPTEADLRGMQIKECLILVEELSNHLNERRDRKIYYNEPPTLEDIDHALLIIENLKGILQ